MVSPTEDRSEVLVRFHRRSLAGLMVITLVLGALGLALALSPPGAVRQPSNLLWWLLPLVIAAFSRLLTSMGGRHIDPQSPELKAAIQDEWRRNNMLRAARAALIVVLVGQWPLGLSLGFLTSPQLTPVRVASAMAAATIMLGIVTTITFFLYLDRE